MNEQEQQKMHTALRAIEELLSRSLKAQKKFTLGTPQHSLLVNRIMALQIATTLLSCELSGTDILSYHTKEELMKVIEPMVSLINKSEKAREKLKAESWQAKMLTHNLEALTIVTTLLREKLAIRH